MSVTPRRVVSSSYTLVLPLNNNEQQQLQHTVHPFEEIDELECVLDDAICILTLLLIRLYFDYTLIEFPG